MFVIKYHDSTVGALLDAIGEKPTEYHYRTEPLGVIRGCHYYYSGNVWLIAWIKSPIYVDSIGHVTSWSQDDFRKRKLYSIEIEERHPPYRSEKLF
jgi:hypothetical protein